MAPKHKSLVVLAGMASLLAIIPLARVANSGEQVITRIDLPISAVGLRNAKEGCWAVWHLHGPVGSKDTGMEYYGLAWVPAGQDLTLSVDWVRVPGDLDADGKAVWVMDLKNYAGNPLPTDASWFWGCFSGDAVPFERHNPRCFAADMDHDGDVDMTDYGIVQTLPAVIWNDREQ